MSNEDMKNFITATFNTVAEGYDNSPLRFFKKTAAQLPKYCQFKGYEYVLDAATGTGMAALSMVENLPDGQVVAVDMSQGMLAQAIEKSVKENIQNVEFLQMDIENLTFPENSFDCINCSFGLFFLEDMESLIQHFVGKIKPGGKFISCSFAEGSFQPQSDMFFENIQQYGVEIPKTIGFQRLDNAEKNVALYKTANLKNIATHHVDVSFQHKNAEEWWEVVWFAGFRGFVDQLDGVTLEKFKHEHLTEISKLSNESGIPFKVEIIFTVGEK